MVRCVAFLRGINVGGNTKVNMQELSELFKDMDFCEVQTYLNSGNVLFATDNPDFKQTALRIEAEIIRSFALEIRVLVKSKSNLQNIINANPFSDEIIEKDRTLFVSFLFDNLKIKDQIALRSLSGTKEIIRPFKNEIYTLLERSFYPKSYMSKNTLYKQFKVDSTTRNWNTLSNVFNRL